MTLTLPSLPDGWVWTTVADVGATSDTTVLTGPFGTSLGPDDFIAKSPTAVPVVTIGCLRETGIDLNRATFVATDKAQELARYRLRAGDVLFSRMATVGRAGFVERAQDGALFNYHLMRLRLREDVVDPHFFIYYVRSSDVVRSYVRSVNHGMTRDGINTAQLLSLPLPLAPRPQQQRLVEAADSLLSRLDAAVASLEKAQTRLKAYRASVLKAAVEGRLVPTEADLARKEQRSYEPADTLLARILEERRGLWEDAELARMKAAGKTLKDDRWKAKYEEPSPLDTRALPSLPEGWCWTMLSALLSEPLRNGHSARAAKVADGIRTLTLSAVTEADFGIQNTKVTVAQPDKVSDLWLRTGDIFVERSNTRELVGIAALYRGPANFAIFPDLLIRVRCNEHVIPEFIEAVLQASPSRRYFQRAAKGIAGTMPKISQSTIESLAVPLAPKAEQQRIIEELQRLRSLAASIDNSIQSDSLRCGRLRQSVLKWAFEGKLVDQDPADEPGDLVVARIRAERPVTAPTRKPRFRKR